MTKVTRNSARKVLKVVRHGLCHGLGKPEPGQMCVEAAVCYALGLPHGDKPDCVHPVVRSFKITLNDAGWSSDHARAKGLERIAIAQLGSNSIDATIFVKELTRLAIKRIVPLALRAAAKIHPEQKHKEALEAVAINCEQESTSDAARAANAANAASAAARAASYAASDAARAASYAASAAARAASYAASDAASYAASDAARAASYAARADNAASDEVLTLMAEIGVEALQICGSSGCKWLDLVEEQI